MQLLKITNIPLEYKYNVEEASLTKIKDEKCTHEENSGISKSNCMHENKKLFFKDIANIDNTKTKVNESKELENNSVKKNNCNGLTAAAVNEYIRSQNMIQKRIKSNSEQEPSDLAKNIKSESDIIDEYKLEYKAGSFEIEIIRRPDVEIEYIGGFNYVPPSSDPDYNE